MRPLPVEHVSAIPRRVVVGLWCPTCALPSVVHVEFSIVWLTATGVGSQPRSRAVCSECRRIVDVTPSGDAGPVSGCTTPGEA